MEDYIDSIKVKRGVATIEELPQDEYNKVQEMLLVHLNSTLNMDLTFAEYEDFMLDCKKLDQPTNPVCKDLTLEAKQLEKLLDKIVANQDLTKKVCLSRPAGTAIG
jgi:hypothetical protein